MKKFINKIVDVPKLIIRIWIVLWLILIILLIMKFCFNIWYPVSTNNETFITICKFFDDNKIANLLLRLFFYMLSSNILFLSLIGRYKYSKWYYGLIANSIYIGVFFLKNYVGFLGLVFEISIVILAIVLNLKRHRFVSNWHNILIPIIVYVVVFLWQLLILIVRNTTSYILDELPTLVSLILMLDYYIFIIITWIGVNIMGTWSWGWFFGKDSTTLKAEKEKELAKSNPNMIKVRQIESRIEQLEKEGK